MLSVAPEIVDRNDEDDRRTVSYPQLDIIWLDVDLLQDHSLHCRAVLSITGAQHGLSQLVHHVMMRNSLLCDLINVDLIVEIY